MLEGRGGAVAAEKENNGGFRERRTSFSLESWEIRPSGQEGKLLYVERASRGYQI